MRTMIITGASDGIGAEASKLLAGDDTRLVVVGRSPAKTKAVAQSLGAEHHVADFEHLDEVRDLAAELLSSYDRIDVLANNAGGTFAGPDRTEDGFEKTFQINHLAPYLLTNLLIDRLLDSRAAVINTASIAARIYADPDLDDLNTWNRFKSNRAYGNAKLANILFAKGLHERFHDRGLSAMAFHPGMIATNFASQTTSYLKWLYQGALKVLLTPASRGGANLAHFVAGEPGRTWQSGRFYNDNGKPGRTHRAAGDPEMVRRHWDLSAQMLDVSW